MASKRYLEDNCHKAKVTFEAILDLDEWFPEGYEEVRGRFFEAITQRDHWLAAVTLCEGVDMDELLDSGDWTVTAIVSTGDDAKKPEAEKEKVEQHELPGMSGWNLE